MTKWDGVSNKLVAVIRKNARDQVQVRLKNYEGYPLIDIRVWYQDRETEEWRPSQKGVSISTELYSALVEAVDSVGEQLA